MWKWTLLWYFFSTCYKVPEGGQTHNIMHIHRQMQDTTPDFDFKHIQLLSLGEVTSIPVVLREAAVIYYDVTFLCTLSRAIKEEFCSLCSLIFSNIVPSALSVLRPSLSTRRCMCSFTNSFLIKLPKSILGWTSQLFNSLILPSMEPPSKGCSVLLFLPDLQAGHAPPCLVTPSSIPWSLLPPIILS